MRYGAPLFFLLLAGCVGCAGFDEEADGGADTGSRDARELADRTFPQDARPPEDSTLSDRSAQDVHSADARGDAGHDAARADSGRPSDAAPADASRDAMTHDAGEDASPDAYGSGLSPYLALPPPDAAPCSPVGNPTVCGIGNCLIDGPGLTGGCQSCPTLSACSGHKGAPCTTPSDCDVDWACFHGTCTLMCPLDASAYCGADECINVGNAYEGVCPE